MIIRYDNDDCYDDDDDYDDKYVLIMLFIFANTVTWFRIRKDAPTRGTQIRDSNRCGNAKASRDTELIIGDMDTPEFGEFGESAFFEASLSSLRMIEGFLR